MELNFLSGYVIGIAIVSAVSGLFIKLGVRLLTHQKTTFLNCFVISFISFLVTLFIGYLCDNVQSKSSLVGGLPAITFFLFCWLLNAQFIKYSEKENSKNYGKAFLATGVQCIGLLVSAIIFSLGSIALIGILIGGK